MRQRKRYRDIHAKPLIRPQYADLHLCGRGLRQLRERFGDYVANLGVTSVSVPIKATACYP